MYIKDLRCISPQNTYNKKLDVTAFHELNGQRWMAEEPDYLEMIPMSQLRRMGKTIRMGIGCAMPLINQYDVSGIVLGSAYGGIEECISFLNQIVEYDEGSLTPTNFVQSTPNAVAGTLALMKKNHCYNATHVNLGHSFENALIDAMLLCEEMPGSDILVGSTEEASLYSHNIDIFTGLYSDDVLSSNELLTKDSSGTVLGEGATAFVLSDKPDGSRVKITEVRPFVYPEAGKAKREIEQLLNRHSLNFEDIDVLMIGKNGDNRMDGTYDEAEYLFGTKEIVYFKKLVGEFPTSSSFALWYAAELLMQSPDKKRILIYNHFKEIQQSLILLESV